MSVECGDGVQAGDDDGSVFMRQMTDAELSAQAALVAAL